MARGRMINQSISKSKKFNLILDNDFDRLLYCLLLPYADRDGRMEGDPDLVNAMVFPRRKDVDDNTLSEGLSRLSDSGLIIHYEVDGDFYIQICQFREGQEGLRYEKEKASTIPAPPVEKAEDDECIQDISATIPTTAGSMAESVAEVSGEIEVEIEVEEEYKEKVKKEKSKRFSKPSILEIKEYCKERGNDINPEKFYNSYEAKGWLIGKTPMKDWKAAVRTWESNTDFQPKEEKPSGRSATAPAKDHIKPWEDVGEETLGELMGAVRR
jgi:hypothetical protein